jgi:hypothetical protein
MKTNKKAKAKAKILTAFMARTKTVYVVGFPPVAMAMGK